VEDVLEGAKELKAHSYIIGSDHPKNPQHEYQDGHHHH